MRLRTQSGFTLIELLLSLAIFTLIGIATVRQISQIQNTKVTAFEDIDLFNDVRSALAMMRSDLSQAFHVLMDDLGPGMKAAIQRNEAVPRTVFDGREKELIFTSLSHRNYYADRPESEQTEISYFLFNRDKKALPSLMKRESEHIDADPYQGGSIFRLVDNVQSLKFEYWDERQDRWLTDWNSDGAAHFDRFPFQVRVTLTVVDGRNQPLTVQSAFKVAFPNNKPHLVKF